MQISIKLFLKYGTGIPGILVCNLSCNILDRRKKENKKYFST